MKLKSKSFPVSVIDGWFIQMMIVSIAIPLKNLNFIIYGI